MRYTFGGGVADWTFSAVTVSGTDGLAQVTGNAIITFWSAETGGVQYTDLLDATGQPTSAITSSDGTDGRAVGQISAFSGPDGVRSMWAQADTGPRALMVAVEDSVDDVGTIWPPLSVTGTVTAPAIGKGRLYNDSTVMLQLLAVRASVDTAPTTTLVLDVKRNGTTIYADPASRPSIAVGANTSGKVTPTDLITIAPGDYITVDTVSGTGAADLTVQLLVTQAAS